MHRYRVPLMLLTVVVAVGMTIACAPKDPADLVLVNGTIATMAEGAATAEALAVRDDRIVAIGDEASVRKLIGKDTQVIDLEGRLATPGLIDSHAHFLSLGYALMRLDLTTAQSWDDIVAQVEAAVAETEPGEWILGRGWHQEKWNTVPEPNVDGLPLHTALSAVSPDNPVYLTHASGHSAIANAKAMELSGVTRKTPEPEGGEIVHDARGNPIGVFRETAQGLIRRGMSEDQQDRTKEAALTERRRAAELAANECLARGITTFHDAGVSFETIDFFRDLVDAGELPIRLYVMLSEDNEALTERIAEYRIIGYGDNRLTVRAIKRLIDGALGSHGAWLLEPYDSLPTSTGLNTEPIDAMAETARIALENDFQFCTHAIGDRGNRETLDVYEAALTPTGDTAAHRWRIEHSQHLHPDDLPRFFKLGIIPAMQGIHCTSDGPWVFKRLGDERAASGAYMWRTLLDSGAMICNGTLKGSLEVGKLADITVLSQDILTVPEEWIMSTKVDYTIVGGKVAYER